ncbi:hypothetical protein ACGFZU_06675 [Streptomyces tendae]|uniref:hypothetical protein n=1 Tax=Streptomyces tendae TaxID=1932 RepID=UPI003716D870
MIAPLRTTVPVPDAVADRIAAQFPPRVQAAVADAAEAGRLLTRCTGPQYAEARELLHQRLARASKVLAAHDPRLVTRWADLPSLNR